MDSKAITFTLDGKTYRSNDKGNRFYKTFENGQQTRISENEWLLSLDKYNELAQKTTTKKRAKKNVAFRLGDTTLTEKQVKFLNLLPSDDFFENGLESTLWIDVLCDTIASEFNPMAVGAMVSTLREKDLIYVAEQRVNGRKCKYFGFTEEGKKIAKELGLK